QGFKRHRASQVRHIEELPGAAPAREAGRERRLRSIQQRETFLRLKLKRGYADTFECLAAGDLGGCAEYFAFTDQHQRKMRERSKIPARADTAAAGNHRIDVVIQQIA